MKQKLSSKDKQLFNQIACLIKQRLEDFQNIPKSSWLREVSLCLLTPQSSPVSAESAISQLENEGFFESKLSTAKIAKILRSPMGGGYVRFHKTKAERLVKFLSIKDQVSDLLHSDICGVDERNKLRDLVLGFGLKEASHSLRNIGRKNLAILDRHILRCLAEYKVIEEVKNLNDKVYFDIEKKFIKFADDNKVTIDELDLFFWWKATGFIYK
jgi:N-glycosylase/DNA lyase